MEYNIIFENVMLRSAVDQSVERAAPRQKDMGSISALAARSLMVRSMSV